MNRNSLIAVLTGIVLGAIVAPGASSASGSYTAGHFTLALDGGPTLYEGPGSSSSANTLLLGGGARTPALLAWGLSGELRDATVVASSDSGTVFTYRVENAWPKLEGPGFVITADRIATPATG